MTRIRVPMVTGINGIQAAAPTFAEVPGSYQPLIAGKVDAHGVLQGVALGDPALANVTVQIDVPDDEVNAAGNALDPVVIKRKYPNHFLVTQGVIK